MAKEDTFGENQRNSNETGMQSRPMARIFSALLAASLGVGGVAASAQTTPDPVPPAAAAAPSLTPQAAALRDAMAAELAALPAAEGAAIGRFYADRAYALFWTEPGSARAAELAAALDASPAQALPRARYGAEDFAAPPAGQDPAALAAREVAATRAYLRFATDLSKGVLTPSAVVEDITRKPAAPPPAALLAALETAPVAAALQGFEPQDPDYRRLMAEKTRLELMGRTGAWGPAVADGADAASGRRRPAGGRGAGAAGAARLSRADGRGGRRPASTTAWPQAVAQFQRDYGLNDDGVVGAMTLAAMNAPIGTRLAQVAVNLERMRWMNGDPEPRAPRGQHPRLHGDALRGRQARLDLEGGGGQDARDRDAGVRRRGAHGGGQPDLAHPGFDRHPRLPAEAAAQPDGAEEPGHRPDDAARAR